MRDRLRGWLDEVVAVKLLRRGWPRNRVARVTGLNRDIVAILRFRVAGCQRKRCASACCECVGPPPRVVDTKAAALREARSVTLA